MKHLIFGIVGIILTCVIASAQVPGTFQPLLFPAKTVLVKSLTFETDGPANTSSCSNPCSWTNQTFGTAQSDRYILVEVLTFGGAARTVSSMTIGGVTATFVDSCTAPGGASPAHTEMWIANVPTGATGTVSYVLSGASTENTIGVYRLTGLVSTTPNAHGNSSAGTGPSLATLASGFATYVAAANPGVTTWTVVTSDFASATTDSYELDGASKATTGAAVNPTYNGTACAVGATW